MHNYILTLRIERTKERNSFRAKIDELDISAPGITPADAMFQLGQNLSCFAQQCVEQHVDFISLIPQGD
jgi:hypothetical protein